MRFEAEDLGLAPGGRGVPGTDGNGAVLGVGGPLSRSGGTKLERIRIAGFFGGPDPNSATEAGLTGTGGPLGGFCIREGEAV